MNASLPKPHGECCLSCHFLAGTVIYAVPLRSMPHDSIRAVEVSEQDRVRIRESERTPVNDLLKCWRGVWSHDEDSPDGIRPILVEQRTGHCFFYPYKPSMTFEAAATLQERKNQESQAERDRKLVRWSIFWGIVGALVGALMGAVFTRLFM
jgi:hypothetical protein